jgi:hypothetical protein
LLALYGNSEEAAASAAAWRASTSAFVIAGRLSFSMLPRSALILP